MLWPRVRLGLATPGRLARGRLGFGTHRASPPFLRAPRLPFDSNWPQLLFEGLPYATVQNGTVQNACLQFDFE